VLPLPPVLPLQAAMVRQSAAKLETINKLNRRDTWEENSLGSPFGSRPLSCGGG
jgi:hypothetical protein